MSDKLAAFLAEAAGKPYRLGEWDCGLWLADWYVVATGKPDPASSYRGIAADAAVRRAYIIRRIAREEGLVRTSEPQCGDIGLVSLSKGHLVGGIYTGTHWCVLVDEQGIGALRPDRFRFVAAWRMPDA